MSPDLHRRLRVLRLRQRVESCSWTVYAQALGLDPADQWHQNVARRLTLLSSWATDASDFDRLRVAAAELGWVYAQCCDVLHGRRAFASLPESLDASWENMVESGEQTISELVERQPQ